MKRALGVCMAMTLFIFQICQARAGLVETETVFEEAGVISPSHDQLTRSVDESTIRDQLIDYGVTPEVAATRAARLTEVESAQIETSKLGGGSACVQGGIIVGVALAALANSSTVFYLALVAAVAICPY